MSASSRHGRKRHVPRSHPAGGRAKPPEPPAGRRRQRPPGGYITSREEAIEALEKLIADLEEQNEREAERVRWQKAEEAARRKRRFSQEKRRGL